MALVQRPLAAVLADRVDRAAHATSTGSAPASPACRATRRSCRRSSRGDGGDPERGATRDDRLQRGRRRCCRARRRRHRVLERRGRRAARAQAGDARSSRSTTSARPAYPELVLAVDAPTLAADPGLVDATVAALRRGYTAAPTSPARRARRADRGRARRRPRQAQPRAAGAGVRFTTPGGGSACWTRRRWRLGRLGGAVRDRARSAPDVAQLFARVDARTAARARPARRATSSAPSRAIRERGTTRSNPAAGARSRVSTSTWRRSRASGSTELAAAASTPRARAVDRVARQVHDQHVRARRARARAAARRRSARRRARRPQSRLHLRAEHQVGDERDDAGHALLRVQAGGTPRARSRAGPTSGRPPRGRCGPRARASRPRSPPRRAARSVPWTVGAAAAWPKRWATRIRQCQSAREYGWALHVTRNVAASM